MLFFFAPFFTLFSYLYTILPSPFSKKKRPAKSILRGHLISAPVGLFIIFLISIAYVIALIITYRQTIPRTYMYAVRRTFGITAASTARHDNIFCLKVDFFHHWFFESILHLISPHHLFHDTSKSCIFLKSKHESELALFQIHYIVPPHFIAMLYKEITCSITKMTRF